MFEQLKRLILEHSSVFITGSYLLMVMIGVFHAHGFYGYFGVPILQYAEITDYLIFPFQHPITIAWYVGMVVLTVGLTLLDDWMHEKFPKLSILKPRFINRSKLNWVITIGLLFIYIPIVTHETAIDFAEQVDKKQELLVDIASNGVTKHNALVIGSTSRIVVVQYQEQSFMYPWESVDFIHYKQKTQVKTLDMNVFSNEELEQKVKPIAADSKPKQ